MNFGLISYELHLKSSRFYDNPTSKWFPVKSQLLTCEIKFSYSWESTNFLPSSALTVKELVVERWKDKSRFWSHICKEDNEHFDRICCHERPLLLILLTAFPIIMWCRLFMCYPLLWKKIFKSIFSLLKWFICYYKQHKNYYQLALQHSLMMNVWDKVVKGVTKTQQMRGKG